MSFSEWKKVKLGDVCNIRRGSSPRPIKDYLSNSGMPWVKIADATESKSRFIEKTKEFIKLDGVAKSVIVNPGSLILSNSGTAGIPKFMKIKACVHDGWQVFENLKDIDIYYLYYKLIFIREQLLHGAYDSVMKNLTLDMVRDTLIDLPSIEEQKVISNTLTCLDDKIELNTHINKTLNETAQAIFKNWFVDFKPFQDGEFEDSELGKIPKGWRVDVLYDFAKYINGTSFKKDEYGASGSGCPIVKITELKNGITSSTEYFSGTKDQKYYIKTGDILFSWSGNPQTSIDTFIWVGGDAILNQHTFKISIKNNDYCFVYLLLKFFKSEFTRIASSKQTTGLGHVTIADLKRLKFPCNDKVVGEFCTKLSPIIEMYMKNLLENKKLRDIRESLLPKLMSGEIRVQIEGMEMNG